MEEFLGQAKLLAKTAEQILIDGNNSGGPQEIDNKLLLYKDSINTNKNRNKIYGISEFLNLG